MSVKLQILLIVVILIAMLYIINLVRKKIIDFRYALLWLLVALCVLVLTIFPRLLILLSGALGITSAVNMLFFLGFCLTIVVIFTLSIAVSNLQDKVKKTAQEIAIIRKDMYDTYQKLEAEIKEEK